MRRKHSVRAWRVAVMLCALLALAGAAVASETPWGRIKIQNYKTETIQTELKFAPFARYTSYVDLGRDVYLKYIYTKLDAHTRKWALTLVDDDWEPVEDFPYDLEVCLPFPSIWSRGEGRYWKWTKEYAERFNWFYTKSYWAPKGALVYGWENYRPVRRLTDYGVVVGLGRGFTSKDIIICFTDSGAPGDAFLME